MAKPKSRFVCQSCGAVTARWSGKCDSCGEWNSIVEESVEPALPKGQSRTGGRRIEFVGLTGASAPPPRRTTGLVELDRVTGGGLVPGSAILIGGDPGIGKSTLLLQATASLARGGRAAYISGEESVDQIRLRAQRLNVGDAPVMLASATAMRDILASLDGADAPDVVVIDSIQTMYVDSLESAPGTVAQVRAAAQELIRLAKRRGFTLILVGHVTKEGAIAGPKVLEHMVDTVLYFEGERGHQFRILRAVKNRYGATDEIGVFEMTDGGLAEVSNPSELFLADRKQDVSGAAVFAGIEGSRPVLVEVQALVAPSPFSTPRRTVVGWDSGRLAMVMAVLEARCGVEVAGADVFLNVAGGLKIAEPAMDLAVAAALVSSLTGVPVPKEAVVFGEIGLSGEVRAVSQMDTRLKEAAKLGFAKALMPARRKRGTKGDGRGGEAIEMIELSRLGDLTLLFDDGSHARRLPRQAARGQG
ncbi:MULTISPECIES: DNA repair protein RadA [Oceanibaculum]|uniref:DNA repair protein RadA n=1 Tax=Oceanibaculum indicum P24 TaxID=1207063 RepID=K2KLB7_9PROT|nr:MULTISPECIES: DNA repair protein RadA [Oceanibaculum]EKE78175.1 DNA repair protein RadA [Oceanibaculum indicum P24]MCH2393709.1 DNA repair protein RadA [Oceanibaculum sp.]